MTKVYNVWAKKVQRSYLGRHWILIQNLRENWFVLSKMTWGIYQIFTRAFSNILKLGLLLGLFIQNRKCTSLEFTAELCVMTMKNDTKYEEELSVQNWHEEFDEFWPEHLKISKICNLIGCFWPKYIMFELKKVQSSYVW